MAKNKQYTLERDDRMVATIDPVTYEEPFYRGVCHFTDATFLDRMIKAHYFMSWGTELSGDISDEAFVKARQQALQEQGLTQSDYEMYIHSEWAVKVSDGTRMKLTYPVFGETGSLVWKPTDVVAAPQRSSALWVGLGIVLFVIVVAIMLYALLS